MDKIIFRDTYTQATSSVALGFSNHQITKSMLNSSQAPIFQYGVFGVSVSGSSGEFGINIMAKCPDGTTTVIAGATALAATKNVFFPSFVTAIGATQAGIVGVMRPYEIQYHRAVGTSISYVASVWGVLYNPG